MRSFSKKLAFVLAAAMVVTSFAPAAKAEAAKEMAINKSSQILYVNEGINHKGAEGVAAGKGNVSVYDFSVKNKPADWKDTLSFKWTSSDEDVVTVAKGGVATAVSVGKATITCKVTDKATKETVATLKTKITVKANADEVEIINADDVAGLAYEVGATVDLNRAMYDENGNRTTKRGTVVTDYTRWIAEPSTGVTIDQKTGKYTFAEAGEFTLYCETYQSSKYTKTTATSEKITVTVASGLEIKQTVSNVFVVNFGKAMDVALDGVTVEHVIKGVDAVSKDECLVRKVTMSEDKKTATVEMFYEFEDGEEYEITVKGYDTETMIASNGVPVKAVLHADKDNINNREVVIGADALIYFKLYDANGVQVESGSDTNDLEEGNVEFKIKYANTDYETASNMLFFTEAGDRAVVTLTYHTWDYDTATGEEKNAFTSSPFTFVGVNKATVKVKTIADYAVDAKYWLGADKNVVKLNNDSNWLEVKIVLTDGQERYINVPNFEIVAKDNETHIGYAKVVSLNPDVVDVFNGVRGDDDDPAIGLNPRKLGTAILKVSSVVNVNGVDVETTLGTVTIQVKAAPSMATVTPEANSTTIATNPEPVAVAANGQNFRNKEYGFTVKDQYGAGFGDYKIDKITGTTNLSKAALEAGAIKISADEKKFGLDDAVFQDVIEAANIKSNSGSFFFDILVKETAAPYATKNITFSVYAKKVWEENPKFNLMIEASADNLAKCNGNAARVWTADGADFAETQKGVTFTVYEMYNGAKYNEVELKGRKPASIEGCTLGEFYWEVKKNGSALTRLNPAEYVDDGTGNYVPKKDENGYIIYETIDLENVSGSAANPIGNGNSVVVDFSKNYIADEYQSQAMQDRQAWLGATNATVVYNNYYDIIGGAGSYEFVLYEVTQNKNTKKPEFTRKLSKTVNATLDTGSYKFVARDAVSVDVTLDNAGNYNKDEMSKALLGCFIISDRSGNTYDKYADSWNNIVDEKHVKFAGTERIYYVDYSDVESDVKSVYVKDIYFWEKLQNNLYAEYVVPVGYYVTVR